MPLRGSQGPKEKLPLVGTLLLVPSEICAPTGEQALRFVPHPLPGSGPRQKINLSFFSQKSHLRQEIEKKGKSSFRMALARVPMTSRCLCN